MEIQATLLNGSVIKAGTGTLRVSGTQTYSSLLAQDGTIDLETPVGTGTSTVTITPTAGTATVNFDASQRLASLTIGDGGIVTLDAAADLPPARVNNSESSPNDDAATLAESQGVPEPGSLSLMFLGVSALLLRSRSKRAKALSPSQASGVKPSTMSNLRRQLAGFASP